ncbi:hypothetical protein [Rhodococcus aetherivorans]|uniref:hypothetical protein n=1 Tax=Rhodococcus aetherivorans TaxID=191292 RepID=UPI00163B5116|nr:hypothetical protein [Rhodococcus aetherivorans]
MDEYAWAVHFSAAYMELICHVEVLLRNVVHRELTQQRSNSAGAWFDDHQYVQLSGPALASIRKARRRITSSGHTPTADRVVAGLTFDFWRFLFVAAHQIDVWRRVRHGLKGLPGSRRGTNHFAIFERAVVDVYDLRNRVAHHEPIRLSTALQNHESILLLAEYIDPAARSWLESISRVGPLLAARPGFPPRPTSSLQAYGRRKRRNQR